MKIKKIKLSKLIVLGVVLFSVGNSQLIFAEENNQDDPLAENVVPAEKTNPDTPDLLESLEYNKEQHIIKGKTKPDANVFLVDTAISVPADEEGNFEFPVPDDITTGTINIMDAINNQTLNIQFDFVAGKIIGNEQTKLKSSEKTDSSSEQSHQQTNSTTKKAVVNKNIAPKKTNKKSTSAKKKTQERKELVFFLGSLAIILFVSLFIILVVLQKYKKRLLHSDEIASSKLPEDGAILGEPASQSKNKTTEPVENIDAKANMNTEETIKKTQADATEADATEVDTIKKFCN